MHLLLLWPAGSAAAQQQLAHLAQVRAILQFPEGCKDPDSSEEKED